MFQGLSEKTNECIQVISCLVAYFIFNHWNTHPPLYPHLHPGCCCPYMHQCGMLPSCQTPCDSQVNLFHHSHLHFHTHPAFGLHAIIYTTFLTHSGCLMRTRNQLAGSGRELGKCHGGWGAVTTAALIFDVLFT